MPALRAGRPCWARRACLPPSSAGRAALAVSMARPEHASEAAGTAAAPRVHDRGLCVPSKLPVSCPGCRPAGLVLRLAVQQRGDPGPPLSRLYGTPRFPARQPTPALRRPRDRRGEPEGWAYLRVRPALACSLLWCQGCAGSQQRRAQSALQRRQALRIHPDATSAAFVARTSRLRAAQLRAGRSGAASCD